MRGKTAAVAGALVLRMDDTIPGRGARTYYTPALPGLPNGYRGSAMIGGPRDAQLTAVVNDVR